MSEKKKSGFAALAKTSLYTQEEMLKVKKGNHSFFIGLPREISLQENRVCLTPHVRYLQAMQLHQAPTPHDFPETKFLLECQ